MIFAKNYFFFVLDDDLDVFEHEELIEEAEKENIEPIFEVQNEDIIEEHIEQAPVDGNQENDQKRTPKGELPNKKPSKHLKQYPFGAPGSKILPKKNSKKRNGKNPGLRQVLSPKAFCSRGPPLRLDSSCKIVQASGGAGSSSMPSTSSSGASSSGSSRMSNGNHSKRSSNSNNNGDLDLENLEYPDSPTSHKWFADNSDLSPLTVLDNINLKTEFPYSTGNADIEKPPDINSITLDSGAENLFQFAASVPNVPDNTTTFLDIGADTFSQSLYDDLGDINMNDFPNVGAFTTTSTASTEVVIESPVFTVQANPASSGFETLPQTTMTTAGLVLTKPLTLEKIETDQGISLGDLVRLKSSQKDDAIFVNTSACNNIQVTTTDQGVSVLKGLIEPLPASALKGLIKIEPENSRCNMPGFIKVEQPELMGNDQNNDPVFSPCSSMASPGSPNSSCGGGKIKSSPCRKKSTSSNATDEDDISNIPSLQTRIQIISQRVSHH